MIRTALVFALGWLVGHWFDTHTVRLECATCRDLGTSRWMDAVHQSLKQCERYRESPCEHPEEHHRPRSRLRVERTIRL